jgi:SOS-response transcriptional repressor LexA
MGNPLNQLAVDIRDQLTVSQALWQSQLMVESQEIRDAFARRLSRALDHRPEVRSGRGRNVDLHAALKARGVETTTQATSKWLRGDSMPEKENMRHLATWLGIPIQWLEYGEGYDPLDHEGILSRSFDPTPKPNPKTAIRVALDKLGDRPDAFISRFGCSVESAEGWLAAEGELPAESALPIKKMQEHQHDVEVAAYNPAPAWSDHVNVAGTNQPYKADKKYPMISWVAAGSWQESCDNFHPGDAEQWISSDANAGEHGYWLTVKGPSMQPAFMPGSRILVRPEGFDLISGKFYIAKLMDTGETTFKQYIRDGGMSFLQPLNNAFPTMQITDKVQIIGQVVDGRLPPIF